MRTEAPQSDRIGLLLETMRRVSEAREPNEAVHAFGTGMNRLREPVDLLLAISVRGLEPGQYKITRVIHSRDFDERHPTARDLPNPWRDWADIPVRTGGFIGGMIAEGSPRLIHDIDLSADPEIAELAGSMRSVMAVPAFDSGEALNWQVHFRERAHGFTEEDLERTLLTGNLFGSMTRNLVAIKEIETLHERLRIQFEQIANIQRALLPRKSPHIPGLSIATSYLTSDLAGGDYYDFFELSDGRWAVLIADVAGHGAGAATVMAMLHAVLHAYPDMRSGPANVMAYANDRLLHAQMQSSFVTAIFGVYDPKERSFTYARAGHPEPRVKDTRTGVVRTLDGPATFPLGIVPEFPVEEARCVLEPGETIVLYTDGITEAFNSDGEMFSETGLDAALTICSGEPDCVVDTVHSALYKHTGERTRADDQTLVVLRVLDEDGDG